MYRYRARPTAFVALSAYTRPVWTGDNVYMIGAGDFRAELLGDFRPSDAFLAILNSTS